MLAPRIRSPFEKVPDRPAGALFQPWPGRPSPRGPLDYISFDTESGRLSITRLGEFQAYLGGEAPISIASPFHRPGVGPPPISPFSLRFLQKEPRKLIEKALSAEGQEREALRHRGGCLAALRRTIARELFEAAEPFGMASWRMYEAFAHVPELRELAATNPGLAVGLAHLDQLAELPYPEVWPRVRKLLLGTRRAAAGVLGFEKSRAVVRLMARIEIRIDPLRGLHALRGLVRDDATARLLSHLPRLTTAVLEAASDRELARRITPAFLLELATDAGWDHAVFLPGILRDTLRMSDELLDRVPTLRSPRQLFELHNRLALDLQTLGHQEVGALPPPPIPGIPGTIEPLTTGRMLNDEGQLMDHCVCSTLHAGHVLRGEDYLYRILEPERATLRIGRRSGQGWWTIRELFGPCNRPVDPELKEWVHGWLEGFLRTDPGGWTDAT